MAATRLNPSAGASFFTPHHAHSPGSPFKITENTPTLFRPLTIRNVTLRNRFIVSPMCQYSAAHAGPEIGQLTDFHLATLGHYAIKGAGLVFIEATGVQPNGRISPNCPGLWNDSQTGPVKRIADFVHSQGALCGIQLGHAGRKGSTTAPWVASQFRRENGWGPGSLRAPEDVGGWPKDVVGPMGGPEECWDNRANDDHGGFYSPRALSLDEISTLVQDFGKSAKRAVEAGVDVIEIHAAHGYLLHQFLSPITNRRTDKYGGSFENRIRLAQEIVQEVRRVVPADMPLFFRISSTDWLEGSDEEKAHGGSWNVESTIELAKLLPDWGIDLIDVSSGGNHRNQNMSEFANKDYQVSKAARVRKAVLDSGKHLLIGAVGLITEAEDARDLVQQNGGEGSNAASGTIIQSEAEAAKALVQQVEGGEPSADAIFVARQFLREPEWVLRVAYELGVDVAWPSQFQRAGFQGNIKTNR